MVKMLLTVKMLYSKIEILLRWVTDRVTDEVTDKLNEIRQKWKVPK